MFLVIYPVDSGEDLYLFFWSNPRSQGCTLPVIEGAELQDLPPDTDAWVLDDAEPGKGGPQVVAQSRRSPKRFRVFRSELDVPMEFDIVGGSDEVWATWEGWGRSIQSS